MPAPSTMLERYHRYGRLLPHMARCPRIAVRPSGFSSVKFVAALPAILMMSWLGVEIGLGVRAMNQARTASDSIALAAAARARDGYEALRADALAAAAASRGPNGPVSIEIPQGSGGGGDVEIGSWDDQTRTFTPDPAGGDAVRARVRFASDHPNGTFAPVLSGLFGPSSIAIERTSVAVHVRARHTTSVLLLAQAGVALALEGSSAVSSRGGVSVRSSGQPSVLLQDDAWLSASVVRVVSSLDAGNPEQVDATVMDGFAPPTDPFAATVLPAINSASAVLIDHDDLGVTHVPPGVHAGLTITGGSVVLLPGVHQFAGSIAVQGGALVLQDATVHLDAAASFAVSAQGSVTGTPATSGDWAGAWILQRGVEATWAFESAGSADVAGLLYAPDATLVVAESAQLALGSAILRSMSLSGTAQVSLDEDIDALKDTPVPGRARLVR